MPKGSKRPSLRLPQRRSMGGRKRVGDGDDDDGGKVPVTKIGYSGFEPKKRAENDEPKVRTGPNRVMSLKQKLMKASPATPKVRFAAGSSKGSKKNDLSFLSEIKESLLGGVEIVSYSASSDYDSIYDSSRDDDAPDEFSVGADSFQMIVSDSPRRFRSYNCKSPMRGQPFPRPVDHDLLLGPVESTDSNSSAGLTTKMFDDSLNRHVIDLQNSLQSTFSCGTPRNEDKPKSPRGLEVITPRSNHSPRNSIEKLGQVMEAKNEDESYGYGEDDSGINMASKSERRPETCDDGHQIKLRAPAMEQAENHDSTEDRENIPPTLEMKEDLLLAIETFDSADLPRIFDDMVKEDDVVKVKKPIQAKQSNRWAAAAAAASVSPSNEGKETSLEEFQKARSALVFNETSHSSEKDETHKIGKEIDEILNKGSSQSDWANFTNSNFGSRSTDATSETGMDISSVQAVPSSGNGAKAAAEQSGTAFMWKGLQGLLEDRSPEEEAGTADVETRLSDQEEILLCEKTRISTLPAKTEKGLSIRETIPPLSTRSDLLDSFMSKDVGGNIVVTPFSMMRGNSLVDSDEDEDDRELEDKIAKTTQEQKRDQNQHQQQPKPRHERGRTKKNVRKVYTSATTPKKATSSPNKSSMSRVNAMTRFKTPSSTCNPITIVEKPRSPSPRRARSPRRCKLVVEEEAIELEAVNRRIPIALAKQRLRLSRQRAEYI